MVSASPICCLQRLTLGNSAAAPIERVGHRHFNPLITVFNGEGRFTECTSLSLLPALWHFVFQLTLLTPRRHSARRSRF